MDIGDEKLKVKEFDASLWPHVFLLKSHNEFHKGVKML